LFCPSRGAGHGGGRDAGKKKQKRFLTQGGCRDATCGRSPGGKGPSPRFKDLVKKSPGGITAPRSMAVPLWGRLTISNVHEAECYLVDYSSKEPVTEFKEKTLMEKSLPQARENRSECPEGSLSGAQHEGKSRQKEEETATRGVSGEGEEAMSLAAMMPRKKGTGQ